jgi:hypothetical protein
MATHRVTGLSHVMRLSTEQLCDVQRCLKRHALPEERQ